MRKTSQDGGDTSSITSGIENETKKPGAIIKTKRNSIKRKVQSLSHESDDAVIEPLLQKDKEKSDSSNQSAKFNLITKTKTDISNERDNDKEKLLQDDKKPSSPLNDSRNVTDTIIPIPSSNALPKCVGATMPLHNHMNTNVFSSHDALKGVIAPKSQILVEIDGSKQTGYNPSPLIFTTAKIHTDGKTKQMEPLQVTPVPILSTIEVSLLKGSGINNSGESSGHVKSNISTLYGNVPKNITNTTDRDQKSKFPLHTITPTSSSKLTDIKTSVMSNETSSSRDKKVFEATATSKDFKNTESKLASNNIKESVIPDKNNINKEDLRDRNEKLTKISLSQPISGSNTGAIKTAGPSDISKPTISAICTKGSSINQTNKDSASGILNQATKKDAVKSIEGETDLNKNISSMENRSDISGYKAAKDKSVTNTSSANKQLQRQKIAIDKDDSTNKIKPNINNPTISNEPKNLKSPGESQASTSKPLIQSISSPKGVTSLSDTTKLPKSTANNVQITSHNTTSSSKSPSVSIVTITKPSTSNVNISVKPNSTSNSTATQMSKTPVTQVTNSIISTASQQTVKSLPNNTTTTNSGAKQTSTVLYSKPQITSTASNKSLSSNMPDTKAIKSSVKNTSSAIQASKPTSSVNSSSSSIQSDLKSIGNKSTENKKTPPDIKNAGNNVTEVKNTAKIPPVSKSLVNTTDSTSSAKNPTSSITTKSLSESLSTTNTSAGLKNIGRNPSGSATNLATMAAKNPPVPISFVNSPSESVNTSKSSVMPNLTSVKNPPERLKGTVKSPSESTSSAQPSTVKSNNTPSIKTGAATPAPSAGSAGVTATTIKTAVPNSKSEAKSTELSNGNKSLKA